MTVKGEFFILTGLYLIILIVVCYRIIRDISNPYKAMAWVITVIFVPLLGLLLYYIFGIHIKRDKIFQRKKPFYNAIKEVKPSSLLKHPKVRLIELLLKNDSSAISLYNKISLITEGVKIFDSLFDDIGKATQSIFLEYYILESGEILNELIRILGTKVQEGIDVYLIYDGFGSRNLPKDSLEKIRKIGIKTHQYMPMNMPWNLKYINYRNHRKLAIIDEHISYIGGMNISDKYINNDNGLGLWKDIVIRVEGPAGIDLGSIFKCDWFNAGGKEITSKISIEEKENGAPVQVVSGGPDAAYMGIMHEYFTLITDANNYVYITTPYFVPTDAIIIALRTAALSGIDVRIMLPYESDFKWLKWCTFTFIKELLVAGVKIYLNHDGFQHGKVMISDDQVTSIGSANLDERSFTTNFEINAVVYDEILTQSLKDHFYNDMRSSEELSLTNFDKRSDRNRFMEKLARLSSPIL